VEIEIEENAISFSRQFYLIVWMQMWYWNYANFLSYFHGFWR